MLLATRRCCMSCDDEHVNVFVLDDRPKYWYVMCLIKSEYSRIIDGTCVYFMWEYASEWDIGSIVNILFNYMWVWIVNINELIELNRTSIGSDKCVRSYCIFYSTSHNVHPSPISSMESIICYWALGVNYHAIECTWQHIHSQIYWFVGGILLWLIWNKYQYDYMHHSMCTVCS